MTSRTYLLEEIGHFFDVYKALEPGKSTETKGWEGTGRRRAGDRGRPQLRPYTAVTFAGGHEDRGSSGRRDVDHRHRPRRGTRPGPRCGPRRPAGTAWSSSTRRTSPAIRSSRSPWRRARPPRCGSAPASPTRPPGTRPPRRPPSPACTSPRAGGPCSASGGATRRSPTSAWPRPRSPSSSGSSGSTRAYLRGEAIAFDELRALRAAPALGRSTCSASPSGPGDSRLHWLPADLDPVPVEVVATGPRVLHLAGTASRPHAARRRRRPRAGGVGGRACTREAGADPRRRVRQRRHPPGRLDRPRALARGGITTFARFSAMDGTVRSPIDPDSEQVLHQVHDAYDMRQHTRGRLAAGHAAHRGRSSTGSASSGRPSTASDGCASSSTSASTGSSWSGPSIDADRDEAVGVRANLRGGGPARGEGDVPCRMTW